MTFHLTNNIFDGIKSFKLLEIVQNAKKWLKQKVSFLISAQPCGGDLTGAKGQLRSPKYPKGYTPPEKANIWWDRNTYIANKTCIWTITIPDEPGVHLGLRFKMFEVIQHLFQGRFQKLFSPNFVFIQRAKYILSIHLYCLYHFWAWFQNVNQNHEKAQSFFFIFRLKEVESVNLITLKSEMAGMKMHH